MENAEKHSHGSSSFHFSPIELIETNWGRSFKNFFLPSIRWMMKEREHERLNREWVTSGGTTGKHGKRHLGWGEQLLIQDALICRINNTRLRETVVTTASNNPWNYSKYHGNRTIPVANPSGDRTAWNPWNLQTRVFPRNIRLDLERRDLCAARNNCRVSGDFVVRWRNLENRTTIIRILFTKNNF